LSYVCSMIGAVAAVKLRQWRGVKPVGGPAGVAITTRFRTTPEDERVLDLVADHMGRLRRSDLAAVARPEPLVPTETATAKRQARRDRLNTRKTALTAKSSARWANAIIAANDAQYRSARDAQHRHIIGLRAAIATIETRLAQPTADTLSPEQCRMRKKAKLPRGYATQAERFQKQRRLQILRAKLHRVQADFDDRIVHVVEGGKRLLDTRHHLDTANLTDSTWREKWECARDRIEALGSGDEPFGNLTITVTPEGELSVRLPKPLEHLANAEHGRYVRSGQAVFRYRADEWRGRITSGKPVSYTITRKPGRAGRYLTASWSMASWSLGRPPGDRDPETRYGDIRALGPVVGVDLNADPRTSTWTWWGRRIAAMPRSGRRLPGSSTTPSSTTSVLSRWRTSTSPMPAPRAAKPWDVGAAANGSVER
jgi:hypothetical protein